MKNLNLIGSLGNEIESPLILFGARTLAYKAWEYQNSGILILELRVCRVMETMIFPRNSLSFLILASQMWVEERNIFFLKQKLMPPYCEPGVHMHT